MRFVITKLFEILDRRRIACDVEDELRFHVEMLQEKYTRHGMSPAEAKAAATRRFGNFERVKHQCVEISRRSSLPRRVLKTFMILLALTGLLIISLNSDFKVARIGTVLVSISILGRLLLYVRGLSPSSFLPGTKEASLSIRQKPGCL